MLFNDLKLREVAWHGLKTSSCLLLMGGTFMDPRIQMVDENLPIPEQPPEVFIAEGVGISMLGCSRLVYGFGETSSRDSRIRFQEKNMLMLKVDNIVLDSSKETRNAIPCCIALPLYSNNFDLVATIKSYKFGMTCPISELGALIVGYLFQNSDMFRVMEERNIDLFVYADKAFVEYFNHEIQILVTLCHLLKDRSFIANKIGIPFNAHTIAIGAAAFSYHCHKCCNILLLKARTP